MESCYKNISKICNLTFYKACSIRKPTCLTPSQKLINLLPQRGIYETES